MSERDYPTGSKLIVGFTLIILAMIWIFVAGQVRYEQREAANAAIRSNTQRVMVFEQYVIRTLEQLDQAATYAADQHQRDLLRTNTTPNIIALIDREAAGPSNSRQMYVINRDGDVVATNSRSASKLTNISSTSIFQSHLSRTSTASIISPPSRSFVSLEWVIFLSRRVNLPDGRFGGIVIVEARPNELTDFLQDATLEDSDLVSVIGLDGITRARREGNLLSFGQNLQGKLVMRMQMKSPNGSYLGPSSIDGLVRYFSHRRLPQYGIFVTSGTSEAAALAPVRARTMAYFIGGAVVTLAIILAAWLMIVSARRRSVYEAQIFNSNERLQEAQKIAKLGDWSFDIKRKEFFWSADLFEMYEQPIEESVLTLNKFGKIVGQHGVQLFQTALTSTQSSGGRFEFELAVRLPSGSVSHRRIVSVPDYDASDRLVGLHGTDQDITPRKILESLQRQVGQLSKLDAIKAIAATLAHELNQPLTAASNYLSGSIRLISTRKEQKNEEIVEALGAVREQMYHAGEIIRRVRNMIDDGQTRSVPTSLSEVILNAKTLFEAANHDCKVTIEHGPETQGAIVLVDPIQIQQILVNLVRNAKDACGSNPKITIGTKRSQKTFVDICVIDNGSGIASDETDLFSSFASSKEDGLGLGLAICRTLIESMGGKIWIEKTGPQGTTICFNVRELTDETNFVPESELA